MERPEALDVGGIVMTGLKSGEVISGIDLTLRNKRNPNSIPLEYCVEDFSHRVVNYMFSTIGRHREWLGIRNS
jgi:UDP-N-acetylglucosamine 2-epimerase (non-hydrolysing)